MVGAQAGARLIAPTPGIFIGALVVAVLAAAAGAAAALLPPTMLLAIGGVLASPLVVAILVRLAGLAFARDLGAVQSIAALLAGAALATITFNGLSFGLDMTVADLFLLGAGLVLLPQLLMKPHLRPAAPTWLIASACLLLVSGLVSSMDKVGPTDDLVPAIRFVVALFLAPLVIAVAAGHRARLPLMTTLWLLSAGTNGAVALSDSLGLTSIGPALTGLEFQDRAAGLTVHPNHLALACAMALPVAVWHVSATRNLRGHSAYLALAIAIALGILASGSRAGIVAGMAGVVFVAFLRHRERNAVVLALVGGAAVILIVGFLSPSNSDQLLTGVQRLSGGESVGNSDATRLEYYRVAITEFAARPLTGNGFEVVRGAHDIYLQLLQAGGLIALAAFGLFALGSLGLGVRLTREPTLPNGAQGLAAALTASIAVWLLAGLAQNQIYDRFLYVPVGLLLALSVIRAGHSEMSFDGAAGAPRASARLEMGALTSGYAQEAHGRGGRLVDPPGQRWVSARREADNDNSNG